MKRLSFLLPAFILVFAWASALEAQLWQVHLNGNETFITGNELQGQYPILWYSGDEGRGVLVGGFGGGVSYTTVRMGAYRLRYQLNLQRSRFYDHPVIFHDENGQMLGGVIGINTNLNASLQASWQWLLGSHYAMGVGLGTRYTFRSITDFGKLEVRGQTTALKERNYALAPEVLFLPVEFSSYFGRFSYALRLEAGLTNFSRLDAFRGDRGHLLFLEVGYRLGKAAE
ncbi:hypothetical protein [Flavilitoribacter nigricans]|uniref:Outer membrane protein beta-barrel domain-containing protein n=1 Tax=Flavilitoribacter nigricans (strain ATCC 23147 / DSM 23189 / NBRC 102662 / NCIMB 1420 / SS-2) TaxID=1122177 RepID=A0A2D0NBM9_FLAN2|nr:hypothetical protein [Flavilitoribacter nigricans]PHN05796.1 hypothetical protein CRP01_15090 [Flavilitoribacter nigricans DSM 23189 = NBRC 102662]